MAPFIRWPKQGIHGLLMSTFTAFATFAAPSVEIEATFFKSMFQSRSTDLTAEERYTAVSLSTTGMRSKRNFFKFQLRSTPCPVRAIYEFPTDDDQPSNVRER